MTNSTKSPKKANLLDPHAIKHLLDESVTEIVTGKGFPEDFRTSNARLGIGSLIIAVALLAQLYPKKFPENRDLLLICIGLYPSFDFFFFFFFFGFELDVLNGILQFISYTKEKDAILFTYPPVGSFTSTGLVVSSKLPRFSDVYTLTIASADPKSISANKPVKLSKSVTKWFTKDGILVEGLFWKDIEGLIDDYKGDHKNKMESEPLLASYPGFLKSNEEEHEGIQLASTNLFLVESQ
ncbi:putative signal peptidase complex subunit 2 [Iris pallida]|uniref:Signal peptidase complex subunit 2 n=1 Tax=Iris pallida TaxID=29817 RepID=A0AAX6DUR9_IRIPA|nr:putative signal peptidase complex subunit 2 [Iris pallida]